MAGTRSVAALGQRLQRDGSRDREALSRRQGAQGCELPAAPFGLGRGCHWLGVSVVHGTLRRPPSDRNLPGSEPCRTRFRRGVVRPARHRRGTCWESLQRTRPGLRSPAWRETGRRCHPDQGCRVRRDRRRATRPPLAVGGSRLPRARSHNPLRTRSPTRPRS